MNTAEEKKKENGLPEEVTKSDKEGGELTDEIAEEVAGGYTGEGMIHDPRRPEPEEWP